MEFRRLRIPEKEMLAANSDRWIALVREYQKLGMSFEQQKYLGEPGRVNCSQEQEYSISVK